MRLIIQPDADQMAQWAANYIASKINKAKPTADKPLNWDSHRLIANEDIQGVDQTVRNRCGIVRARDHV